MKKKRENRKTVSRRVVEHVKDEDLRAASGGVSLNYGTVEWTYKPQKPDGTLDPLKAK